MAAVLAQSNSFKLTGKIGRRPTDAELYMAHFMGVGGAGKLISNAEDNPNASGARLFPNAAAANRSIFYDKMGHARSVSEVYSVLNIALRKRRQFAGDAHRDGVGRRRHRRGAWRWPAPRRPRRRSTTPPISRAFPSRARPTMSFASAETHTQPTDPIFRSLFQAGERSQPVSPAVQELWGNSSSLTSAGATPVASATPVAGVSGDSTASAVQSLLGRTPDVRAPRPLDLFSDRAGIFSS